MLRRRLNSKQTVSEFCIEESTKLEVEFSSGILSTISLIIDSVLSSSPNRIIPKSSSSFERAFDTPLRNGDKLLRRRVN